MAKYKYILTVIIILCTITSYAQPAQYTPMTASGYQMKRLKVDSTLHLPSFCGVPNLRGSVAKDGALAIDTCGGLLYMWTNINGWDTINVSGGGGGGDFWKTSGTTILTGNDSILSSNGLLFFGGYEQDMARISLNANDIEITMNGGDLKFTNLGQIIYDTSFYKPLVIGTDNGIRQSASWVGSGSTIDTTNQFVKRLDRTLGKDSIIYYVGANRFAIKDSVGTGGSSQNGRFGNDTATVVMAKVHNNAGVTLNNGKVVAFSTSGTSSDAPSVKLANNKADSTSATTFGFVSGTIAVNDTGWVILSGKIEKLNTSAFSNGDIIYLDSISGQYTNSKPQAPYHLVYLGTIVKANAGNGAIYVKVQNGYELSEIHDVKINGVVNNQILAYSDTQNLWKNRNIYSIVDTTNTIATKSNVALKLNISDTSSMLSSYSTRINGKLNISDTSVFQRKSIPSYTFLANNTTATANATTQYFKDTSGIYTSSIAWNGTAPTSGNLTYRWTRIGKMVTINISLVYANAGSANSTLTVALPSDAPTPSKPAGLTSALNNLYPIVGSVNIINQSTLTNSGTRGFLRNNTANNGFEFNLAYTATTAVNAFITCTYFTD